MKCLTDHQCEVLLRGEAGLHRRVWKRHLSVCAACRRRFAQVQANLAFLDELDRKITPDADILKAQ